MVGSRDRDTRSVKVGKLGDGVREDRERMGDTLAERDLDETVSGRMDGSRDPAERAVGVTKEEESGSIETIDGECMDERCCEGGGESSIISGSSDSGVYAESPSGECVKDVYSEGGGDNSYTSG
jgi:hypothetical protein